MHAPYVLTKDDGRNLKFKIQLLHTSLRQTICLFHMLARLNGASSQPGPAQPIGKLGAAKGCLELWTSWGFCHRLGAYGGVPGPPGGQELHFDCLGMPRGFRETRSCVLALCERPRSSGKPGAAL